MGTISLESELCWPSKINSQYPRMRVHKKRACHDHGMLFFYVPNIYLCRSTKSSISVTNISGSLLMGECPECSKMMSSFSLVPINSIADTPKAGGTTKSYFPHNNKLGILIWSNSSVSELREDSSLSILAASKLLKPAWRLISGEENKL